MKIPITLIACILFTAIAAPAQVVPKTEPIPRSGSPFLPDKDPLAKNETEDPQGCLEVTWVLFALEGILKKDCLPSAFQVTVENQSCFLPGQIEGNVQLFFNGQVIAQQTFNPFQVYYNFILSYDDLDLDLLSTPAAIQFETKLQYQKYAPSGDLGPNVYTLKIGEKNLQLLSVGDTYEIERVVGPITVSTLCAYEQSPEVRRYRVCDDNDPRVSISLARSSVTVTQNQISANLSISVNGDVLDLFSLGTSLGASYSYTISESLVQSISVSLDLEPTPDVCKYPGLKIQGNIIATDTYEVTCDPQPSLISTVEDKIEIDKVNPIVCTIDIQTECENCRTTIYTETDDGNYRTDDPHKKCRGSIFAETEEEPGNFYTYTWEGPDGFISFDQNLENVPYGEYILTVRDGCGGTCEYTVVLCPEKEYGEWTYDKSTGFYCRPVHCVGSEDCTSFDSNECAIPEYGEWYFNPSSYQCERVVILNGSTTDFTDESTPDVHYDYDAQFNECIRLFICGANEYQETQEPTDEGDWTYDGNICYREVTCFDLIGQDFPQQENYPQIRWEYDETSFEGCVGYVFCDEFDDPYNSFDADSQLSDYAVYDWDYFIEDCVATVYCGPFQEEVANISQPREVVSVSLDEDLCLCELEIACGDETFYDFDWIDGDYAYTNDEGVDYCHVICEGEIVNTLPCTACPTLQDLGPSGNKILNSTDKGIPIAIFPNPFTHNILLRNLPLQEGNLRIEIVTSGGIKVGEYTVEDHASAFSIETASLAAGLYFLAIYDDGGALLVQKKVIKMP